MQGAVPEMVARGVRRIGEKAGRLLVLGWGQDEVSWKKLESPLTRC